MTEQQKFSKISKSGKLEIRQYAPYVAADVVVEGGYRSAGNAGFRPLANYIFSNKIAMTAPVIIEPVNDEKSQVTFVMPDQSQLEAMPTPSGAVALRASDGEVCAAISFRGYTGEKKVAKMSETLLKLLAKEKIEPIGKVRVARFDPPWKPGFLRHNEVIVPIKWPN